MAVKLNSIFLDADKIDGAIRSFRADMTVDGPTVTEQFSAYKLTIPDSPSGLLHVHYRIDSTVTLNASVGKNKELSLAVAEHVANTCKKTEYEPRPLGLDKVTKQDWDFLIDYLRDEWKFQVTEEKLEHGVRFRVKKAQGDEVFLHFYNTGRFLMQGKAREVYGVVASLLCELTPDKQAIVQAQLISFDLTQVKAQDLLKELKQWTPSAVDILGDAAAAIIAPSLALAKLNIELTDYSAFAYPALRGLEAYMKSLMAEHGVAISNAAGFGSSFNGPKLKSGVSAKINCQSTVAAVEISYALYNKHRPSLFHTEANVEFSRIIERKEEAVGIVHDVLRTIEQTASKIPK
ncbi:MAG: type II toxin-antitoxin system RnlA family toxin [Pseudomonadota bacterium]